jgi:hypothetical protein
VGGVSGFEFEDLAPSCGTGADGDYDEPGGEMICGVCLFPLTTCICPESERTPLAVAHGRIGNQRGGQPCGNNTGAKR